MDNIRMAARVCQGSFRRILYMPRFYIAFLWLLFLYFPLMNAVRSFSLLLHAAEFIVIIAKKPFSQGKGLCVSR